MFNNEIDFMKAMLDGRQFNYPGQNYTFWYDNVEGFLIDPEDAPRQTYPNELRLYYDLVEEIVKPVWYENIPKQGVLCKVSGYSSRDTKECIALVNRYLPDRLNPFFVHESNCGYSNATPLTSQEVQQYIYQP